MQLTGTAPAGATAPLHLALAAASAALLAPLAAHGQVTTPTATSSTANASGTTVRIPWQIDSAVLLYKEGGGRVSAFEPVVNARRTDGNDRTWNLTFTFDALTGASPNGAVPQPTPQTFTSPSGESSYTTPAGATPLDASFQDKRGALAFSLEQPWGENQRLSIGANVSAEYDFKSFALNTALARDFNNKNTAVSLGAAIEADRINAVGGSPLGLQQAFNPGTPRASSETRQVLDLLVGVTQVVNRRWLMQLNYGLGRGSGSHNDPYKVLSVVDGSTGLLTGDRFVTEARPDQRTRHSVYWQNKIHLNEDVVDVSYRYYRDDWGVRALTLDARYRHELAGGMHIEPHVRHYRQSAADFWRGWLVEGQGWSSATHSASVSAASADPRLAKFTGSTLGAKLGLPLGAGREFTVRLETYRQKQATPASAPGVLQTLDLVPTLKATTVLLGYSFPL